MEPILAWHFCPADKKLGHNDNREIRVGETLTVDCTPSLCEIGLHASIKPLDALYCAASPAIACRVKLGGRIEHNSHQLVATERTVIAMADVSDTLRNFACRYGRYCHRSPVDGQMDSRAMTPEKIAIITNRRKAHATQLHRLSVEGLATSLETGMATFILNNVLRDVAIDVTQTPWRDRIESDKHMDDCNAALEQMLFDLLNITPTQGGRSLT